MGRLDILLNDTSSSFSLGIVRSSPGRSVILLLRSCSLTRFGKLNTSTGTLLSMLDESPINHSLPTASGRSSQSVST